MSADATRILHLKVVYEDAASAPAKAAQDAIRAEIRKTAAEQEKADRAYVKAIKAQLAATKQIEAEKERATRQAQREQDKADAAYVKAIKEKLRAEKQLEAEKERATRQAQREQDKADQAYIRAVKLKLRAEKDLEEQQEEAFKKQYDNVTKIVGGIAAMGAAAGTFSAHFDKIRQDAFHAAEDVMKMRGAVRELQALRDQMGSTGAGVAHVMEGASQTLLNPEDFDKLEKAGLGVGELAIKGKGDRKEFDKAMVAAGRMAATEGGDADAYGQMMGQIALQSKGPLDAAKMEAQAERLYQIQKPGGFKTMTQALGQYSGMNPYVMNGVYSPEEAMGLVSAFSVSSPNEAGTKADQFTRAVMAGRIRNRGMPTPKGIDMVKSADYFKSIGIGEQDTAMERGNKIAADLAAQQAAAEKAGKKFNASEYLMTHGFANQEDALAIMDYAGLRNTGRLQKIEDAQRMKVAPGAITGRFNDWKRNDNFARARETEIAEKAADAKKGLEEEPLVMAQRAAFARLKAQGKISGTFEEWKGTGFFERGSQDLFYGGYHSQVNQEAQRAMQAERKRLGLKQNGSFQWSEYETMKRSAREIQEAGGDVRGDMAAQLKQMNEGIQKLVEYEDRKQQGRDARPMPNVPPPLARGNGVR